MSSINRRSGYLPLNAETGSIAAFEKRAGYVQTGAVLLSWPLRFGLHLLRVPRSIGLLRACHIVIRLLLCTAIVVSAILCSTAIFSPSYTVPPPRYTGTNPNNEKVFIAANIINEDLIRGPWGSAVLDLVDILGSDNVFLSIYENDSGPGTAMALQELKERVTCNSSIVSEHLPLEDVTALTLPTGGRQVKRIAYLAEVRNRALRPLDSKPVQGAASATKFDKVLFLNDVVFSAKDAANLLFATDVDAAGKTRYRSACAMDFINPFKFYDTLASRDLEGFATGVPIFPWFSSASGGFSKADVISGTDAVRVRSCWGGMVAFDAKYFQDQPSHMDQHDGNPLLTTARGALKSSPEVLRFRAQEEVYWESSECCLIQADLQIPRTREDETVAETGIVMNPFIRVAYDEKTFKRLYLGRRIERAFGLVAGLLNWIARKPEAGHRRLEIPGQVINDVIWTAGHTSRNSHNEDLSRGSYKSVARVADTGGFCVTHQLMVMNENPQPGEKSWKNLPVPPLPSSSI